jgi:hypothetical protein
VMAGRRPVRAGGAGWAARRAAATHRQTVIRDTPTIRAAATSETPEATTPRTSARSALGYARTR